MLWTEAYKQTCLCWTLIRVFVLDPFPDAGPSSLSGSSLATALRSVMPVSHSSKGTLVWRKAFLGENDTSEKQPFQYNTLQPKGHHRDRDIVWLLLKAVRVCSPCLLEQHKHRACIYCWQSAHLTKVQKWAWMTPRVCWGHLTNNKAVVQTRSGNTKLAYWLLLASKYYYYCFLNKWFINDKALWCRSMYLYCLCTSCLLINVTKNPVTKLAGEWAARLVKPVGDSGKSSQVTTWLEASRYLLQYWSKCFSTSC